MDIYEIRNIMRIERKTVYDLPLRVTFYARVSTMKEEQDSSIEAQISHFTEQISKNSNWIYVEGYVDRVRGESAENRVQFQNMIDDGFNGKFDLILTKEVSRFARDTIDSLNYTRELLKHGVGVFFLTDNICTIDQDSELRLTIMSSIAQDEVRKLSERIKFGHKKAIENGHVLGNSRIFGYKLCHAKLVIDENEADLVKTIFETYATGEYGLRDIEKILWDKGYRNRNGKLIHHNTISGIIQNPKYKGYYCGNKVKVVDYRTKEQKFLPEEEWVMYKDEKGGIVPAIVSEEVWEQANKVFIERSTKVKAQGRSAKTTSKLSGKIICGCHNEPFWRTSYSERIHPNDPVYQWICRTKKRGKSSDCSTIAIYESELYSILGEFITRISGNIDEYIEKFIQSIAIGQAEKNTSAEIKRINEKISSLEKKKEKLLDLYTDEIITKEEFKERNDSLQKSIYSLTNELRSLKDEEKCDKSLSKDLEEMRKIFNDLNSESPLSRADKDFIDNVCDVLLDKIVVYPVDNHNMTLEIYLKLGVHYQTDYTKSKRSLGHMFKKMSPKLRTGNTYYLPSSNDPIGTLCYFETYFKRQSRINYDNFSVYNVYVKI